MENVIDTFRGEYYCFSNFGFGKVYYEGMWYDYSENAFQAAKTTDLSLREKFQHIKPSEAKRLGRRIPLRKDWEEIKIKVMYIILISKFKNKRLREKLLSTGDKILIEGNYHHDNTWGHCKCNECTQEDHYNLLGKLLMKVREFYRQNPNL